MDMEDHGPDWDEDTVHIDWDEDTIHIEVEDELRLRKLEAEGVDVEKWGEYIQTRRACLIPKLITITQADQGAGVWKGFDMSTEA